MKPYCSDSPSAFDSIVKHILSTTETFLKDVNLPSQRSKQLHPSNFHVSLPEPPPLLPALVALGADTHLAHKIDELYTLRASEFRAHAESAIAQACSKASMFVRTQCDSKVNPVEKIISAFTQVYLKKLLGWVDEGVALLKGHVQRKICANEVSKLAPSTALPFNHEYTPLLEHFFDENPFPTHADKIFLAKKSNMTYRQIHVWFQNKRNRTKKARKVTLRRKPMSEGATLPLDNLCQRMGRFIIPEHQRTSIRARSQTAEKEPDHAPDAAHVLNALDTISAPAHAFPAPYLHSPHNPLPSKDTNPFVDPIMWTRKPSSTRRRSHQCDVADLVESFAQMNVRDDCSARLRTESIGSSAATLAFTVAPLPAPLPALITRIARTKYAISPLPSVSAPPARLHVFATPSPGSRPITLASSNIVSQSVPKQSSARKVAPLPKRLPRGLNMHRAVTPATSEASIESPSPSSRCCSSSSDTSNQTASYSSVSPFSSPPYIQTQFSLPASIPSPSLPLNTSNLHHMRDSPSLNELQYNMHSSLFASFLYGETSPSFASEASPSLTLLAAS
ncbi:hypothetical protein BDN67DRAFT_1072940 [Paxillus ammoniavirescens]|nr:hypothetical protein BDN67DRAFT_1072940 [Paxillus ammoniavirescens]